MVDNENSPTDLGIEGSNPNASGAQGLSGGMGVSSERTGPYAGGARSADEGVQGTGTVGEATTRTEGTMTTERHHPQEPAEGTTEVGAPGADTPTVSGPEMDDTQQEATQGWADTQPAAGEGSEDDEGELSLGRSAAEVNSAEVPTHEFDRTKNPGHSNG